MTKTVLSNCGWNFTPPLYHFIEKKKQFFKHDLGTFSNYITFLSCSSNILKGIIKEVSLRLMRVKYKEESSSLCRNCSDISLAMGLPTSLGFIELKEKHQIINV